MRCAMAEYIFKFLLWPKEPDPNVDIDAFLFLLWWWFEKRSQKQNSIFHHQALVTPHAYLDKCTHAATYIDFPLGHFPKLMSKYCEVTPMQHHRISISILFFYVHFYDRGVVKGGLRGDRVHFLQSHIQGLHQAVHLTVSLYLCSSGSNRQGE